MKKYILTLWVVGVWYTPVLSQNSKTEIATKNFLSKVISNLNPKQTTFFSFTQTDSLFGHSRKPWKTYSYNAKGQFDITANSEKFFLLDSLDYNGKMLTGMKYFCDTTLIEYSYGRNKPRVKTADERVGYPLSYLSIYTPVFVLQDFLRNSYNKTLIYFNNTSGVVVYSFDEKIITIKCDPKTETVDEISILYHHEMYGDVKKKIKYSEYKTSTQGIKYPSKVVVSELGVNQHTLSVIETVSNSIQDSVLSKIPGDYRLSEKNEAAIDIEHITYKPRIHFLNFKHTDDRVFVVELDSFFVVAEAPLESRNGELIIEQAKKIAPNKPIKYFVFGHHHPHYLGGVRPFINNGTTILTHSSNIDYLKQVASFKHTLQPDALQKSNKPLIYETVGEKRVIADLGFEIHIIHIGWMSKHTDDYLVYYFPKYKLLIEDDLVWIKKKGSTKAAGDRQKGLYDAIKKYGLDVETIIQSWPINYMEVKTEISFKELEETVLLLNNE